MSSEENSGDQSQRDQPHPHPQPPPQYGTFQGVVNYPRPVAAFGLPHPVPRPGYPGGLPPPQAPQYYVHGYQAVPGIATFGSDQVWMPIASLVIIALKERFCSVVCSMVGLLNAISLH